MTKPTELSILIDKTAELAKYMERLENKLDELDAIVENILEMMHDE